MSPWDISCCFCSCNCRRSTRFLSVSGCLHLLLNFRNIWDEGFINLLYLLFMMHLKFLFYIIWGLRVLYIYDLCSFIPQPQHPEFHKYLECILRKWEFLANHCLTKHISTNVHGGNDISDPFLEFSKEVNRSGTLECNVQGIRGGRVTLHKNEIFLTVKVYVNLYFS